MKVSVAKTKICPFIQHVGIIGNFNLKDDSLDKNIPVNIKCLTCDCMAWLYSKEYDRKIFFNEKEDSNRILQLISDGYEKYTIPTDEQGTLRLRKELPTDEKEGWCERLS